MKLKFILPLVLFLGLSAFLLFGLFNDPREVPSPLINKPAPEFALPRLDDPSQVVTKDSMKGQVWMMNVWASWCVSCRQEHPMLVKIGKEGDRVVPIIGLDYKDKNADGKMFLARNGDPYDFSITDPTGEVGINFGVYGVPETFVIDKKGVIRYKQIGPITEKVWNQTMYPLIQKLEKE
ncbi:MAG: DsbE family thiol:disulfide interchange protein [Burkholderiaceae bacterium]|nr:DsbE family thiol:disulfide interchange protein [Burkholderiaceae bacterium]